MLLRGRPDSQLCISRGVGTYGTRASEEGPPETAWKEDTDKLRKGQF